MVDINASNIDACKRRFQGKENVSYLVNGGSNLSPLRSETYTSIFCYDAMVHFEALDVISYILDISRVLVAGGQALLHYSVNDQTPHESYLDSTGWQNYFSEVPNAPHRLSR